MGPQNKCGFQPEGRERALQRSPEAQMRLFGRKPGNGSQVLLGVASLLLPPHLPPLLLPKVPAPSYCSGVFAHVAPSLSACLIHSQSSFRSQVQHYLLQEASPDLRTSPPLLLGWLCGPVQSFFLSLITNSTPFTQNYFRLSNKLLAMHPIYYMF